MRCRVISVTAALTFGALLAGCGSDGDTPAGPTPTSEPEPTVTEEPAPDPDPDPTATEDPDPEPTEEPPDYDPTEFSPEPIESDVEFSDAIDLGYLRDIRIGVHDGFERIVFEFDGTEEPNVYFLEWVTEGHYGQTDDVLEFTGEGILELVVSGLETAGPGATPPEAIGAISYDREPLELPDLESSTVINEVYAADWYHAEGRYYIGADMPVGYRVSFESNPSRVVIDIAQHM